MKTRKDYMAGAVSHEDYYGQFVTPAIIGIVRDSIGEERIKASADPHFNDIPLYRWDVLEIPIRHESKEAVKSAGDSWSLSSAVCIAKAAAKQILEGVNAAKHSKA